ncbi:hypothetical protein E2C01_084951 [Portunus trituberculatus]|uniref:Uncharacterized protein n=1 Tax=Portunus trituberculatus TaxID=210409 RepID=A0A5B7J5D0_PORTR|nr:hypothetical protein [Portunus trituberculatus]
MRRRDMRSQDKGGSAGQHPGHPPNTPLSPEHHTYTALPFVVAGPLLFSGQKHGLVFLFFRQITPAG